MTSREPASTPAYGASEHYDAGYFNWQDAGVDVKIHYKTALFGAHVSDRDAVLDFGCAGGSLIASIDCGKRLGVEINPVARRAASERGIVTYPALEDVPDNSVDVVITSHTLEHIPHPYVALRQIRDKLKPDGKLVLLLPIDDWRRGRKYHGGDVNNHLYTWTPLLLGNLLTEAGYRVHPSDIRRVRHAMMRHFEWFDTHLPRRVFNSFCTMWSYMRHAQEIIAVARPIDERPPPTPE